MLSKRNSRIVTIILAVAILSTMFVGFASAAEKRVQAAGTSYSFWMRAPGHGGDDTATVRVKESRNDYADYMLTTVSNTTGKYGYINVRASDAKTIVGDPETVTGRGAYAVTYLPGNGIVGYSYCPSCMSSSSSDASGALYIEGTWTP